MHVINTLEGSESVRSTLQRYTAIDSFQLALIWVSLISSRLPEVYTNGSD